MRVLSLDRADSQLLSFRFQAVLSVRGAESVFKIVEINDFKQVSGVCGLPLVNSDPSDASLSCLTSHLPSDREMMLQ